MKRLIAVMVMIAAAGVFAQQTNERETFRQLIEKKQQTLLEQYGKGLDRILLDLKKKGDLDNVLILQGEKKRFDAENKVPAPKDAKSSFRPATEAYCQGMVTLLEQYVKALDRLIKKEVAADRIEEAKAIKAEKDRASIMLADIQTDLLVKAADGAESRATSVTMAGTTGAISTLPAGLPKGAVLYCSFAKDEGDKIADESGQGNDGKATGPRWTGEGRRNGSLTFGGSGDRVEIQPFKGLTDGGDLTISVWAKPKTMADGWCAVLSTEAFRVELTGDLRVHWDWTSEGNSNIYTAPNVFALNKWFHLVLVKTGDSLGFYVNGKRVHSQQNVRSKTEIRTLRLGMDGLSHIGGDDFYSGQIDEIRIFNRALTPTEILKVYRE
ncbi:MAG: LamG domain-containing protein [bacterium]